MDKELFLHPSSAASDYQLTKTINRSINDYKLTKSASFSELSSKKKMVIEKQYQTQRHGSFVKQYSCEQIFDGNLNTSQIKVSTRYKTDDAEHVDTWEKTIPVDSTCTKPSWFCNSNTQITFQRSLSNQNPVLTDANDVYTRSIISPAKFIVDENKLKQLNVKEQSNVVGDKQVYVNNESSNLSFNSLFKKPLPIVGKELEIEKDVGIPGISESIGNVCEMPRIDENKKQKLDTSQLKKRLRSLVAMEPKKKSNMQLCWSLTFFILLPIAVICLGMLFSNTGTLSSFCTPRFSLERITQELKRHVYDQDIATSELDNFFNEKDNRSSFEVVAFVGGIGVGKSFAAEIIKNSVKETDKVLDFFPPMYDKEDQAYAALSICRCNLIRLENCKTDDIADVASFTSNLKKRADKYCVLVLAIFNTEEVDHNLKRTINYEKSISMIKDTFGKVNVQPSVVSFTSLNNEALVKCIKDAGDYNNVKLSKDNIDYVMRDLLTAESGCKGAYAKVQLVGKA